MPFASTRESLPFLTADRPGIGGTIKHVPEDFEVEEIPAYEPCGAGEHLFLWVEKRDVSGEQLVAHVARALGISRGEVGTAGLKDRRAVTRQFVSVPARCAERLAGIEQGGIRVLRSALHRNKLRTGHLRGNRFSVLVREVGEGALERATAIAARVEAVGFPNYFGEQRFGREGETAALGFDLLAGRKTPRDVPPARRKFLLRLALSAVQSVLFNQALAERLSVGGLDRIEAGHVLQVVASGGLFVAEDAEREQQRFEAGEVVPAGPLFGPKMIRAAGEPGARESRLLEQRGLASEVFTRYRQLTSGARRAYLVRPRELSIEADPAGLRFRFALPPGAYATMLLREFSKPAGPLEAGGVERRNRILSPGQLT